MRPWPRFPVPARSSSAPRTQKPAATAARNPWSQKTKTRSKSRDSHRTLEHGSTGFPPSGRSAQPCFSPFSFILLPPSSRLSASSTCGGFAPPAAAWQGGCSLAAMAGRVVHAAGRQMRSGPWKVVLHAASSELDAACPDNANLDDNDNPHFTLSSSPILLPKLHACVSAQP